MLSNCRVTSVTALLCLLAGCAIKEPAIRHGGAQSNAVILAGSPQVFSRESLINQRRADMAWVEKLQKEASEPEFHRQFGADIARQVEAITAISASLSANYDQGAARSNSREDELARLRHEMAVLELRQSIAALGDAKSNSIQAAAPKAAGVAADVGEAETTGEAAADEPASGIADTDANARAEALLKLLDTRLAELRAGTDSPLAAVGSGPRERLRDLLAYREDLNALYNELQLDDLHDADGRALYKLRIPVTIVPGATNDRYAALSYQIHAPVHESQDYEDLYLRWLGHLTYRMNQGQDSRDTSQMSNRELQFFGVSSRLFYPVTFYVSPQADPLNRTRSSLVDPCLGAASWVEAAAVAADCIPFTAALPYEVGIELTSLFPHLEHLIIPLLDEKLASDAKACTDSLHSNTINKSRALCLWDASLPSRIRKKMKPELQALPYINQSVLTRSISYLANDADHCRKASNEHDKEECLAGDLYKDYMEVRCKDVDEAQHDPCATYIRDNRRTVGSTKRVGGSNANKTSGQPGGTITPAPIPDADTPRTSEQTAALAFMTLSLKTQDLALLKDSYLASTPSERQTIQAAVAGRKRLVEPLSTTSELTSLQSQATGGLNAMLLLARNTLTDAQLAALIDSAAFAEIRLSSKATLPYTASILQGLSQREEIATVARNGAENVVLSLLQLTKAFPGDAGQLPAPVSACGDESLTRFRRMLEKTGNSTPYVYSVAPNELAQRVSISSSAAEAITLAAALSAAKPLSGLDAQAAASFGRQMTSRAQAMERLPLVVGYAQAGHESRPPPSATSCEDTRAKTPAQSPGFGWIFGPRQRVVAGTVRDIVKFDFPPASFDVTVDLALPGWWKRVELRQQAAWIGDIGDRSALLDTPANGVPVVNVELPAARGNLDALTRVLARSYGGAPPTARIVAVVPQKINLCPEKIGIAIRGPDLWRGAQVSIAGMPAASADISVLPDMDGLQVSFATGPLRSALAGLTQTQVSVFTQNGVDSYPLDIERTVVGAHCAPQSDPRALARIVPTEVHRCAGQTDFSIEFPIARSEKETRVYVGGSKVNSLVCTRKATTQGHCFNFTFSSRLDVALLRGRDSFPIYVAGDGAPVSFQVNRVGSGDRCGDGASKPSATAADTKAATPTKVDKVSATGEDGALRACLKDVDITLQGSGLDAITSVELMGVKGTAAMASAAGDLRVFHFSGLPRLGDTEGPKPTSQPLGVVLKDGKPLPGISIPWVACGKD